MLNENTLAIILSYNDNIFEIIKNIEEYSKIVQTHGSLFNIYLKNINTTITNKDLELLKGAHITDMLNYDDKSSFYNQITNENAEYLKRVYSIDLFVHNQQIKIDPMILYDSFKDAFFN